MITPEQRATLRKSANNPSQLFDAGMMSLVLDALDAAEARAAELVRAVRAVFEADHPINEMHAERALRQLVYKNGGAE